MCSCMDWVYTICRVQKLLLNHLNTISLGKNGKIIAAHALLQMCMVTKYFAVNMVHAQVHISGLFHVL
jgi:hypothetical protein